MSRIALIGENSIEYIERLIDIWNNGDCAILISHQIPIETAILMMHEAKVTECFIEKRILDNVSDSIKNEILFIPYVASSILARLIPREIYVKYRTNYSHDEAVVIYSSGTTGKARGIILSHNAITTNADAIIDYMRPKKDDCIYTVRPFSHSSTLTGELLVALRSGCKLLIAPTIVPPRYIFGNIEKYQVTILCINPTLLYLLCGERKRSNTDVSSLRTIYSSGSILNDELFHKAKENFCGVEICNVYGLTEAGPRVAAQGNDCCQRNSVGKPIRNVEVVIVDESGKLLAMGKRGIVHVNTPSQYSGYISGEEKYHSYYKHWLNTGDIGYFDEHGELHIVDRIDDMIFIGSQKIYPSDVAAQIMKYADVDECVVTVAQDMLCCIYSSSSEIRNDIKKMLGKVLMKYEIPKIFIRTEALQKTRTGKISMQHAKDIINHNMEYLLTKK